MHDIAGVTEYRESQQKLAADLHEWMRATGDPRAEKGGVYDAFDKYPYFGQREKMPESKPAN
jgi:hypothetical protein